MDCVVAQRLVRTLCTYCKRRTMLSVDALEAAGFHAAFDVEAYEPVGCGRCGGSGYKGRIGVYEVMDDERGDPLAHDRARLGRRDQEGGASSRACARCATTASTRSSTGVTSIAEVARVT